MFDDDAFEEIIKKNDVDTLKCIHKNDPELLDSFRLENYIGESGYLDMIKFVLSIGLDPGKIMFAAVKKNNTDIVEYIFENYEIQEFCLIDCFNFVCYNKELSYILKYFLRKNIYFRSGASNAVLSNNIEALKLFTVFDLRSSNESGDNLLMESAVSGSVECFEYLLNFCDPNMVDSYGCTTLHYLLIRVWNPEKSIFEKLLDATDHNIEDNYGKTAFFHAIKNNEVWVVKRMIEHPKVNIFTFDNKGNNALQFHIIYSDGDNEIFDLIISKFDEKMINHKNKNMETALMMAENKFHFCKEKMERLSRFSQNLL